MLGTSASMNSEAEARGLFHKEDVTPVCIFLLCSIEMGTTGVITLRDTRNTRTIS
jgi:hypothetical protein